MFDNQITAAVGAGLATGIGFIIVISSVFTSSSSIGLRPAQISIVKIPYGTAAAPPDEDGLKEGFQPKEIRIVIGLNNTVRWVNEDITMYSVVAANSDDPNFFNATTDSDGNPTDQVRLIPRDSFQYTFTKPGTFEYYSVPHPWMQGTVVVLP